MSSLLNINLKKSGLEGVPSKYTAVAGMAQLLNVKRLKNQTLPTRK